MEKYRVIILAGPTASGKTEYAIRLAEELDGEIVSCDSMQIYKYLDIGSAKPDASQLERAKHHLVDCVDPRDDFSVAEYQIMAKGAIKDIAGRGKTPVVTGGTGLYMNSLIYDMDFAVEPAHSDFRDEMKKLAEEQGAEALHRRLQESDPEAAERIHPNNVKKVIRALEASEYTEEGVRDISKLSRRCEEYDICLLGITWPRETLYERINKRVDVLIEAGLEKEIKQLLSMGLTEDNISMKGIGYKEMIGYIHGEYDLEEAVRLIKRNTRHYAKRQMTWFRRYEDLKWFDLSQYETEDKAVSDMLGYIRGE